MSTPSYAIFSAQYPPHLGGIETFSRRLAQTLTARGASVTVVTNDTEGLGASIAREDDIDVVRLPCLPLISGRLPLPRHNRRHRTLMRHLDDLALDGVLVNARFYPHSLLGMRVARRHGLTPVVLDHGSAWLSFSNPMLDPIVRLYERAVTAWGRRYHASYYGISERSAEWLRTFGIEAEGVIPNAIDAQGLRASSSGRDLRAELGLGRERLMVAFVGRLIPEKGVRSVIAASRDERLAQASVTFVLAGDGPLAAEVRAAEGPCLHWVGALGREDTAALLAQADLLCLPTRSEGFSTVLLEAAACGCPSLVTDVGGAREVIAHDECGRILEDDSPGALVHAIGELAGCRDELRRMGARCRERVERLFTWDATAAAFEVACQGANTQGTAHERRRA